MKKEACFLRIVDDDGDVRELLSCLFEFDGWETRTYAGAEEFLHSDALLTPGCMILGGFWHHLHKFRSFPPAIRRYCDLC